MYSVPYYLENDSELTSMFEEARRVLKPNGQLRAFPITDLQRKSVEIALNQVPGVSYLLTEGAVDEEGHKDWLLTMHKAENHVPT